MTLTVGACSLLQMGKLIAALEEGGQGELVLFHSVLALIDNAAEALR